MGLHDPECVIVGRRERDKAPNKKGVAARIPTWAATQTDTLDELRLLPLPPMHADTCFFAQTASRIEAKRARFWASPACVRFICRSRRPGCAQSRAGTRRR